MFVGPRSATGARGRGCSPAREPSPSWVSPWPLWRAFRLGASRGVFRRTPPPRPRRGSNPALTAAPAPSSQVPRMQPLPAVVREAVPDGRPDGLDERLVLRAPPLPPPPRLRLRRVRLPPHRPAQRPHPPRRRPRRGGPQDPRRARPHRRRRGRLRRRVGRLRRVRLQHANGPAGRPRQNHPPHATRRMVPQLLADASASLGGVVAVLFGRGAILGPSQAQLRGREADERLLRVITHRPAPYQVGLTPRGERVMRTPRPAGAGETSRAHSGAFTRRDNFQEYEGGPATFRWGARTANANTNANANANTARTRAREAPVAIVEAGLSGWEAFKANFWSARAERRATRAAVRKPRRGTRWARRRDGRRIRTGRRRRTGSSATAAWVGSTVC